MRTLRSPEGCPWDREQTLQSLTPFVLEEAHEVIDAIERGDMAALKEEIGDHIFEGVFLAQVAADDGTVHRRRLVARASSRNSSGAIRTYFRRTAASTTRSRRSVPRLPTRRSQRWNSLKAQERAEAGQRHSTLGSVPKGLPSLLRAYKIGKRVAAVGFDWDDAADVIAKIEEEVAELRETLDSDPGTRRALRRKWAICSSRSRNCPASSASSPKPRSGRRTTSSRGGSTSSNRIQAIRPRPRSVDTGRDGSGVGERSKRHEITRSTRTKNHEDRERRRHEDPRRKRSDNDSFQARTQVKATEVHQKADA